MIKELKDFDRVELFDVYNKCDNPFLYITINIDITNVVHFTKENSCSFYATMGYLVTNAINSVENFKYRFQDGKLYYCDKLKSNFTQKVGDKINFFTLPQTDNLNEYLNNYNIVQEKLTNSKDLAKSDIDEVWLSCFPWFKITSLLSPYNKSDTIPQIIWDKYEKKDDKYYINVMLMAHHGFVDGYHFAQFFTQLNENIKSLK